MRKGIIFRNDYERHSKQSQTIINYEALTGILLERFGLLNKIDIWSQSFDIKNKGAFYYGDEIPAIILNKYFMTKDNKIDMIETICHEVSHAIQYDMKGYTDHDDLFLTIYKAINPKNV